MKRVLASLILAVTAISANAGPHHGHGHWHRSHGGNWGWVAPAIIGGAVVYAATRPVIVQQPPVVVQQPNDIVYIDGIAYRKQIMIVNGVTQEVLVRI